MREVAIYQKHRIAEETTMRKKEGVVRKLAIDQKHRVAGEVVMSENQRVGWELMMSLQKTLAQ